MFYYELHLGREEEHGEESPIKGGLKQLFCKRAWKHIYTATPVQNDLIRYTPFPAVNEADPGAIKNNYCSHSSRSTIWLTPEEM